MIKAVLWDVGGVLLTDPDYKNFWQGKVEAKRLRTLFGEGNLDIDEFVTQGSRLLGITKEDFREQYTKAYCAVERTETIALYKQVQVPQYILSDTNPIHGPYIKKNFPEIFPEGKVFFSFEIGMLKRTSKVFEYVAREISVVPEEVLFIDNKEKNCALAQEAGMKTHTYTNKKELEKTLFSFGLL